MRPLVPALCAALAGCGTAPPPAPPSVPPPRLDPWSYLVESRCTDGALAITEPGCAATPRDVSTVVTSRRHDWPAPTGYQVADSFLSSRRAISTWSYPPFGPFVAEHGDGGEVYIVEGDTVRIAETQDGGSPGVQVFSGAECGGTGWVLFRTDASAGHWAELVAHLDDIAPGAPCSAANLAFTRYRLEDVAIPFLVDGQRTARTLPTIISEHYDAASIDTATAMERTFLAQGFGRVIWEAWTTGSPTGADLDLRCAPTVWSVAPGPGWTLSDCRVLTNIRADAAGVSGDQFGWPHSTAVRL